MTPIRPALYLGLVLAGTGMANAATADKHADTVDALALYSQGMAVVQDKRTIPLKQGTQRVAWPVPGAVQPETFWLHGKGVTLNGFDTTAASTASQANPLAARINQPVWLVGDQAGRQQGKLVALDGDTAYVQVGDRIQRITASTPVRLEWPAGADADQQGSAAPALSLNLNARSAGKQSLDATYQIAAPSWQASYTGRFDAQTNQLVLQSSAVIDNAGHAALDADKAWLVAGDTARADNGAPRPMMMAKMAAAPSAAGQPEAVGDLYRYPLAHGLHVAAGATRVVSLMAPVTLKARRQYRFENYAMTSDDERQHVGLQLVFDNQSKQPLPAGAFRIYDAGQAALLMGGGQLGDTPAGAPVALDLGRAFDVTATHQSSTAFANKGDKNDDQTSARTTTVKITLHNASDTAHQITLAERLPAKAELASDAPKPTGGTASAPQWQVSVPANGDQTFSYRFTQPM